MDYKQKYEEALERARVYWETDNDNTLDIKAKGTMEYLFPELAEGEGDRIRKEILEYFQQFENEELRGVNISDWIAWLEKQESEPNWCHHKVDLSNCSEEYRKAYYDGWNDCNQQHSHSKSEGNDVVKCLVPKFKVGDWVVWDNKISCHIDNIYQGKKSLMYTITDTNNMIRSYSVKSFDNNASLWTIQDAKDGDVLFHSDSASNGIFIFKELLKYEFSEKVICYCDYDSEDNFCLGEHHTCCWADAKILHPATKEQRDILFQKMHEAGYTFDFEKKELKEIHVIDEGKSEMDYCFTKMMNGEKVTPAWSEEDELQMQEIIDLLPGLTIRHNWLRNLKERYTWKPSDEQMEALEHFIIHHNGSTNYAKDLEELRIQLKKLKGE